MNAIVLYKSKYGSTKQYAEWIANELGCDVKDAKGIKINDILDYDTIIYGGGLYAEIINGVSVITKNIEKLDGKKIAIFSTGITPIDCREYYDKLVVEKNFTEEMLKKLKVFNFLGRMVIDELSLPHKAAIKTLKKIMSSKENPSEMELLLVKLCEGSDYQPDREVILPLLDYVRCK